MREEIDLFLQETNRPKVTAAKTLTALDNQVVPLLNAMAKAKREKRAKIIAAEGELLASEKLGQAADVIASHPIALQLRNLQTLAEISIEKNSTIIFPAQMMSTVEDLNNFMRKELSVKN